MKSFSLTQEQIRARLGISTMALDLGDEPLGESHLAKVRELGIRQLEIGVLGVSKKEARRIAVAAKNQGLEIVSVHGAGGRFSTAYPNGITEDERRQSVERAMLEGEAALEAGARIILFHFGTTQTSEASVYELLDHFKDTPLILGGENVGKAVSELQDSDDVQNFVSFTKRINSDRFGLVLDTGHARDPDGVNPFIKLTRAYETVMLCEGCLIHLHLHDATPQGIDDHYPPFDGEVRWTEVFSALERIQYAGSFMFEPMYEWYSSIHDKPHVLEKVASFPEDLVQQMERG